MLDLEKSIVEDKINGLSDQEIGNKYNVNLRVIEKSITKKLGINVSNPKNTKSVRKLFPTDFNIEKNTVWSFKSRGNWATHNGNYRGNWSPYIPRNIILKYSNEDDLVLDYFCGSGTTAVEAKLLHRNFIGIDINENAIELAKENINFDYLFKTNIKLKVGDARNLNFIKDNSVDLICAHPPYSNIINYTHNNENDLSNYEVNDFLNEIEKIAIESYRVLKDNKYCSILIGDMRKNKNVIPLGFWTIEKFLNAGFKLKELIIKRQHNCKTTGFWYTNSIKFNFLLLAHEYLAVFEKSDNQKIEKVSFDDNYKINLNQNYDIQLESTTVWIFGKENWLNNTLSNLIKRYSKGNYSIFNIKKKESDLLIYFFDNNFFNSFDEIYKSIEKDGILAVICEDQRLKNDLINSIPIDIEKHLKELNKLKIKEIIVIQIINENNLSERNNLNIDHKYILIYKKD